MKRAPVATSAWPSNGLMIFSLGWACLASCGDIDTAANPTPTTTGSFAETQKAHVKVVRAGYEGALCVGYEGCTGNVDFEKDLDPGSYAVTAPSTFDFTTGNADSIGTLTVASDGVASLASTYFAAVTPSSNITLTPKTSVAKLNRAGYRGTVVVNNVGSFTVPVGGPGELTLLKSRRYRMYDLASWDPVRGDQTIAAAADLLIDSDGKASVISGLTSITNSTPATDTIAFNTVTVHLNKGAYGGTIYFANLDSFDSAGDIVLLKDRVYRMFDLASRDPGRSDTYFSTVPDLWVNATGSLALRGDAGRSFVAPTGTTLVPKLGTMTLQRPSGNTQILAIDGLTQSTTTSNPTATVIIGRKYSVTPASTASDGRMTFPSYGSTCTPTPLPNGIGVVCVNPNPVHVAVKRQGYIGALCISNEGCTGTVDFTTDLASGTYSLTAPSTFAPATGDADVSLGTLTIAGGAASLVSSYFEPLPADGPVELQPKTGLVKLDRSGYSGTIVVSNVGPFTTPSGLPGELTLLKNRRYRMYEMASTHSSSGTQAISDVPDLLFDADGIATITSGAASVSGNIPATDTIKLNALTVHLNKGSYAGTVYFDGLGSFDPAGDVTLLKGRVYRMLDIGSWDSTRSDRFFSLVPDLEVTSMGALALRGNAADSFGTSMGTFLVAKLGTMTLARSTYVGTMSIAGFTGPVSMGNATATVIVGRRYEVIPNTSSTTPTMDKLLFPATGTACGPSAALPAPVTVACSVP
jgi:hypothetical protein